MMILSRGRKLRNKISPVIENKSENSRNITKLKILAEILDKHRSGASIR